MVNEKMEHQSDREFDSVKSSAKPSDCTGAGKNAMVLFLLLTALWLGSMVLILLFVRGGMDIVRRFGISHGLYHGALAWVIVIAGFFVLRYLSPALVERPKNTSR